SDLILTLSDERIPVNESREQVDEVGEDNVGFAVVVVVVVVSNVFSLEFLIILAIDVEAVESVA
ncbi:GSCOCG00003254001-RA-CDS, partial [Cotesia congregata]